MARVATLAVALATFAGCASIADSRALETPEPEVRRVQPQIAHWRTIGESVEGRAIQARTVGHGPLRVFVIGSIHGDEREGRRLVDSLAIMFRDPSYASKATIYMVRDANPDGSARGSRRNARGVDLNRNWPASNFKASPARGSAPLSEPEVRVVADAMTKFDPDLVVVFHSTYRGPFCNYDGPAQRHAKAFVSGASRADRRWRIVPDMGYPTPGSLGSWVGVDRGTPILTVEFDRGQDLASSWLATKRAFESLLVESEVGGRRLSASAPVEASAPSPTPDAQAGASPR